MKRNIYTSLALIAMMAVSPNVFAQTKNLSLEEAIKLSLANSGQLKVSQARIDEATASLREMRNNRLPDFKASGSYLRLNQPNIGLKVDMGNSNGNGGSTGNGGATQSIKVDQMMYGMATLTMPLFSGLRIHYGIESAKYLEQAARLDADKDREEVIQNTIDAYSNLYKASKAVSLVRENLKQSEQRVADFSNLEKNGILARNDLLKAQLQSSNIELSLLDAENNMKITNINMNLMLGLPENTELVPDSAAFSTAEDIGSISTWEAKAFENRKDVAALSLREKAASAGIRATKGEYYPGIALTGGYIAADIPNFLTITNAVNAGIGLQYNISSLWKTGAKVAGARARLHELEANKGMLSDAVRIQINQAYQNYLLAQKKIDVYAKAIEQANENYKITKNKYDNSLATTTDLLDADIAQLQAKLNYTFAKADATVAYKKLLQTAGILETK